MKEGDQVKISTEWSEKWGAGATCGHIVKFEFDGKVAEVKCVTGIRAMIPVNALSKIDIQKNRWRRGKNA